MGAGSINVGGMYLAMLVMVAGMLIHLVSLGSAIASCAALVRRSPRLERGFDLAIASLALSCFSLALMLLVVWWAGGTNLQRLALLSVPSITISLAVLALWKLRLEMHLRMRVGQSRSQRQRARAI